MNLQHIEAVAGIVENRFNMSAAAEVMGRTQPGLSRQIKELELELGLQIFVRTRNKVISLTPQGAKILRVGERILRDLKTLHQIGTDGLQEGAGELRIATTHVHARHLLPRAIKTFTERFPGVVLTLQQSDPDQCRELIASGKADVGIITMSEKPADRIVSIPAYRLPRCVIAPRDHPLVREKRITLEKLAKYPIIAYPAGFSGRSIVDEAFARAGLRPHIVCSATDADVCKAYVEVGMGIAVLARIAFDPAAHPHLDALDANHLFKDAVLNMVFRKHGYLNRTLASFANMFAPHIERDLIVRGMEGAQIDRARRAQQAPVAVRLLA